MSKIKSVAIIFGFLLLGLSMSYLVFAFTEPTVAPPGGNVSAPLNVGPTGQSKQGGLILNTGGATNGLIVQSGNVGIGTTSPADMLHISNPGNTYLRIESTDNINEKTGIYLLETTAGTPPLGFLIQADGALNVFNIGAINGATFTSRLFIDGTGNVGIGTTGPSYKLDIVGALRLQASSAPTGANGVMYYDSTLNKFRCYQAGAFVDCIGAGGGLTGSGTATQVAFWSGTVGSASTTLASTSNLFWDNVNSRLGIGIVTPSSILHVQGTNPRLTIQRNSGADTIEGIRFLDQVGGSGYFVGIETALENAFVFRAASDTVNERMRITQAGNVGIGTTSPAVRLHVSGGNALIDSNNALYFNSSTLGTARAIYATVGEFIFWNSLPASGGNTIGFYFANPAVQTMLINGLGDVSIRRDLSIGGSAYKPGGGLWTDSSDIRLKKNVQTIEGALDKMLSLHGVTFEWIEPEKQGNLTGVQLGLVAQEVEKVFPQWVGTDTQGYKNVTLPIGFQALTIEAFKELKAENDELRSRIEALENKVK